jgi:hypothetical protein
LGFGDDGEDLNCTLCEVIEHPDFTDPQSELGPIQAPKTLDSTPTELCGLESKVSFDRISNLGPRM